MVSAENPKQDFSQRKKKTLKAIYPNLSDFILILGPFEGFWPKYSKNTILSKHTLPNFQPMLL